LALPLHKGSMNFQFHKISKLLLFLIYEGICLSGFSQKGQFQLQFIRSTLIQQEKLFEAKTLKEMIPDYPNYYTTTIDYTSLKITTTVNGSNITCVGESDTLSEEQKKCLRIADPGTAIEIQAFFKYKDSTNDALGTGGRIKGMRFSLCIVPAIEAEFPGGRQNLFTYLSEIKDAKNSTDHSSPLSEQYFRLRFTINEQGQVERIVLLQGSSDSKIANILEKLKNMPRWTAARNSEGQAVPETFTLVNGPGC
jgi:hypothetical protein